MLPLEERLEEVELCGKNNLQCPPQNSVYVLTPPFAAKQKSLMHICSHTCLLRQYTWMLEKLHHSFGRRGTHTHSLFLLLHFPLINFPNVRPHNSNSFCLVSTPFFPSKVSLLPYLLHVLTNN